MASVSAGGCPRRFYHAASCKSSRGRSSTRGDGGGRQAIEHDAVEPGIAARVKPEIPNLGTRDRPVKPGVERDPRHLLGEHRLSAHVEPLPLGSKGQLAGPDEEVVQPAVLVEGEVRRLRALDGALAGGERV